MTLRAGSLCSGYEGIGLGLSEAGIAHELVFVADPDPAAAKVLAHHYPHVPNLGDITAVDWPTVAPVDLLAAGYPCQGFSLAGQRLGEEDERFIWPHVADAVRLLRPRSVLLENVAGHRSLGFGRVLGDLAAIGYDASWVSVRACDVGAAHQRERVFILAHPAGDPWRLGDGDGRVAARTGGVELLPTPKGSDSTRGDCRSERNRKSPSLNAISGLLPTPRTSDTNGAGKHGSGGMDLRTAVSLLPTPTAERYGSNQSPSPGAAVRYGLDSIGALLPTPTAVHHARNATANRIDPKPTTCTTSWTLADVAHADRWGHYAPLIARWEAILGRAAPDPTEPGRNGPRLAARFTEWLMGLPDGWVCDVPGLSRNDMLRLLGNGVVRQQLAHAIRLLAGGAR